MTNSTKVTLAAAMTGRKLQHQMQSVRANKHAVNRDLVARKATGVHAPFYYHIHLYMPCNQKCIMCVPNGRHPKDLIPFPQFEAFFDQIKSHAEHITLIGGETLMYPWMEEVIDLLAEHKLAVTISTNGTMLTEKLIGKLLTLRELNLRCSIDAATAETYHKIRGTDWFERVTRNFRLFSEMASDYPAIRQIMVYVVMKANLHEVLAFVELAKEFSPHQIQFHPVRHVTGWSVENGTGWTFNGSEQSCESFKDDYNAAIRQAARKCGSAGISHEVMIMK